jgi:hypothetical protein
VWGSGSSDVFAVGYSGTILHYDGMDWSAITSGTDERLFDVWGSGPSDVFAVGYDAVHSYGVILHYDGTGWSVVSSGTIPPLRGVWGSGPSDVFAVGLGGSVLHYGGETHLIFLPLALKSYAP